MASSKGLELLIMSSNLTSTMKTLFKEVNFLMSKYDKSLSLAPQDLETSSW